VIDLAFVELKSKPVQIVAMLSPTSVQNSDFLAVGCGLNNCFRRTRTRWLFELRRFRSLIEAVRGTCLGFLSQADDTIGDDLFGVEVRQEALGSKNGDRLLDIASEVQTRGRSNVGFDVPEVIGDREFWLTRQRGMDRDEPT
jgi:hypothetical protein